jgi:hypothetical protein
VRSRTLNGWNNNGRAGAMMSVTNSVMICLVSWMQGRAGSHRIILYFDQQVQQTPAKSCPAKNASLRCRIVVRTGPSTLPATIDKIRLAALKVLIPEPDR